MTRKKKAINLDQFFEADPSSDDLHFLLGATPDETVARAEQQGLPLLHLPPAAIGPDPHQLRHLPHPDDLLTLAAAGDRAAMATLAGLRELGHSLTEHGQLQPIIVYPQHDPAQPALTHRLLNGQRRWSAAILAGLPSLWVVEVPPPASTTRLLRQYEENERRENFSDMERAWAVQALKEALTTEAGGEVPWSVVEHRLQLSEARRHDLLRLLRFSATGQDLIARYRWPEWTVRPLHMAVNAGTLTQTAATAILEHLTTVDEVTATVVSRAIATHQERANPLATASAGDGTSSRPSDVRRHIVRMRKTLDQIVTQAATVPADERVAVLSEVEHLMTSLASLVQCLTRPPGSAEAPDA